MTATPLGALAGARRAAGWAVLSLSALCLGLVGPVSADDGDAADPGGSGLGQGATIAGPILAPAVSARVDNRIDASAYSVDRRLVAVGSVDPRAPSQAIPYRVEPKIDGQPPNAWDLPPESPDPRDFEQAETFDQVATPHYTLHEEIWNNVEDLITTDGFTRYGGLAYVPFWARNTIRYGRWSFFPFVHAEAAWTSNLGGIDGGTDPAWEFMTSAGLMAEYFGGGSTKAKVALRADYRWFTAGYDDAYTYVGGASLEHQFGRDFTVDGGFEGERSLVPADLRTSGGGGREEPLFERWKAFADARWDRFLGPDWRLDAGGDYIWVNEVNGTDYGGDYEQMDLYGRVSYAIMRHEGFAYLQYGYTKRDAQGDSSSLDWSNEVRLGIDGIQPFARTRRLVGDVWVGYRWESYTPSSDKGSVGAGGDTTADLFTFGGTLTYRPTPYTSSFLSFEHDTSFSAIANYNTTDAVYLGVTQNLSNRLVGRLAVSGTRVAPESSSDSSWLVGAGAGLRYVLSDNLDLSADYQYEYRFAGAGYDQADSHRIAFGATLQMR